MDYLSRECGITQFIDVGSDLPTVRSTHEVAQGVNPEARVVYVDNDPIVLSHGQTLLAKNGSTAIVEADARDPAGILDAAGTFEDVQPDMRAMIENIYEGATSLVIFRSREEIEEMFAGWRLLPPGIAALAMARRGLPLDPNRLSVRGRRSQGGRYGPLTNNGRPACRLILLVIS